MKLTAPFNGRHDDLSQQEMYKMQQKMRHTAVKKAKCKYYYCLMKSHVYHSMSTQLSMSFQDKANENELSSVQ